MTVVREVDPAGPDLERWHAVHVAALRHDRPDEEGPDLRETRAGALAGRPERDPAERVTLLLALDGDRPVGAARVEHPLRDNTHLVYAEGHVLPGERRRGAGTALLRAVQERAEGRPVLTVDCDEPPALAGRSPGRAFLARHGFSCVLTEVRRALDLPVPEPRLAALEDAARARSAGYDVVAWTGRCPDALVEARAELGRVMSVEVPLGGLDWHEEAWDAARVREREQLLAEQGRTALVVAARESATGALVGYTELVVRPARPALVEQWDTLVLPAHRGARLGLLVKTAALRRLAREVPGARRVVTTNADTNAAMGGINEALGFVPDGLDTGWQRNLAGAGSP